MRKGQIYKGFKVIDVRDLDIAIKAKGIFLKHEESGLVVFHILADDKQNFFSFNFRTPSTNSTGVQHIIEHSVLCGSEKFPLKDPFNSLESRCLNTYMNAQTSLDHTMYPASSIIEEDYFKIMEMYADAVFFPLLREESFMQEGHRLEYDSEGNCSIQGVVFNEMQGAFSDQMGVVYRETIHNSFKGTQFEFEAGGDPVEIPYLTYEDYKAYYKKHYCTANCLVYLYGNIPTKKQLDFLDEKILSRIKDPGKSVEWNFDIKNICPENYKKIYIPAGENEEEGSAPDSNIFNLTYVIPCDDNNCSQVELEVLFLEKLLLGIDGAPLKRVLMDSGLGDNVSLYSGASLGHIFPAVTFALTNVQNKNCKKIESLILKTLEELEKNGFDKEYVNDALHSIRMGHVLSNASTADIGKRYLGGVAKGYNYHGNPYEKFYFEKELNALKQRIEADPDLLKKLIKKFFLDNTNKSVLIAIPSDKYNAQMDASLKKTLKLKVKEIGKKAIVQKCQKMYELQSMDETELVQKILPKTELKNLSTKTPENKRIAKRINNVPVLQSPLTCKDIVSFSIGFPVDVLDAKDYEYVSILPILIGDAGWKGCPWDQAETLLMRYSQGIGTSTHTNQEPEERIKNVPFKNLFSRDLISISFTSLIDDFPYALNLLKDCLLNSDFSDEERVRQLLVTAFDTMTNSIASNAYFLAMLRGIADSNSKTAAREIFSGYTSYVLLDKILKMNPKKLASELTRVFNKIRNSGAYITFISDKASLKKVESLLPEFIQATGLKDLDEPREDQLAGLLKIIDLKGKKTSKEKTKKSSSANKTSEVREPKIKEVLEVPGSVGYITLVADEAPQPTKESANSRILERYLSRGIMYKKVRMEGGAYGVYFHHFGLDKAVYYSYRDPDPLRSFHAYVESLQETIEKGIKQDDLENTKIMLFSDYMSVDSPMEKGANTISNMITGRTAKTNQKQKQRVLDAKVDEVMESAKKFLASAYDSSIVIACSKRQISSKMKENASKIISLTL